MNAWQADKTLDGERDAQFAIKLEMVKWSMRRLGNESSGRYSSNEASQGVWAGRRGVGFLSRLPRILAVVLVNGGRAWLSGAAEWRIRG